MSHKIKYSTDRNGEYIEFPFNVTRLLLPNGDEYTIRYDSVRLALVINKAYSDGDSAMTITPMASNQIILK